MKISNYIKSLRQEKVKTDLLGVSFLFIISIIGIIVSLLLLEAIFYFSPYTKKIILIIFSILLFLMILSIALFLFLINKKYFKNYSGWALAKIIGENVFPKNSDTALNAFQIEINNNENQSNELANNFTSDIAKKIQVHDPKDLLDKKPLFNIKIATISVMLLSILLLSIFSNQGAKSFYRWNNYSEKFYAPKPFKLMSLTKNHHILGGEKSSITIICEGAKPDTVYLQLSPTQVSIKRRDSLIISLESGRDINGFYQFKLPELFQDYEYSAIVNAKYFYEAWEIVNSKPDTIFVTDRPKLEEFEILIIPPSYSRLPSEKLDGSIAVVQGLKGSKVKINLSSNRKLKSSFIKKNDSIQYLSITANKGSGSFIIQEEGEFSIHLVDPRGITNRDPIPYRINVLPDYKPNINIIKPTPIITLGNNQIIEFDIDIEDDFGFENLQLAYEIIRPDYLNVEPYISMFIIPELIQDTIKQNIKTPWNLSDIMLMPDDEVHYHFELTDNDNISGPKKTVSEKFIAKIPSLADLYQDMEKQEESIEKQFNESVEELSDLKAQIERMELDVLKAEDELEWEDQQKIKEMVTKAKDELDRIKNIAAAMEKLIEESEKHNLFLPDLAEKFKELSSLINDIIPENIMKELSELKNSLDNMDLEELQNSLEKMASNMNEVESELDRYIDIFKRLKAEQKLDELKNRLEKLIQQKNKLDDDIKNIKNEPSINDEQRIAQEEQRLLEELKQLNNEMDQSSNLIEPFSENSADKIEELSKSVDYKNAKDNIQSTISNLQKSNNKKAKKTSQEALNNLYNLQNAFSMIQQQFQNETVSKMATKLEKIMRDFLFLSKKQENLKEKTSLLSRNSSRLKNMAYNQQLIQDQLRQTTEQMAELSKETFSITPEIGKAVGLVNNSIEKIKSDLTDRNIRDAMKNQDISIEGMNETALYLFQSIKQMQSSGSASGFEQFLKMMQQMAGQQQGLNQKGMGLSLGQMSESTKKQMLQSMLQGQEGIQKSLQQLIKEMKQSGNNQGQGDLKGISKDIDDVISDISKNTYNRNTKNKQRRILSRMLDSQTSLAQRGYKEKRKSYSNQSSKIYSSSKGLPENLGQRQSIALEALNRSLNSGYSKEYQTMIKRYFNAMSQIKTNSTDKNEDINP
ncbi:MAG: hypothetical protein ACJZ19_03890 [Candidatus Neomarinimicrobiota bacterium]